MADGNVIELNQKDSLSPEEALTIAARENFSEVVVVGIGPDGVLSVWPSGGDPVRAYWLAAKAANALLEVS